MRRGNTPRSLFDPPRRIAGFVVVEYSAPDGPAIDAIVRSLPSGKGRGSYIWEPTHHGHGNLFDKNGGALQFKSPDYWTTLVEQDSKHASDGVLATDLFFRFSSLFPAMPTANSTVTVVCRETPRCGRLDPPP